MAEVEDLQAREVADTHTDGGEVVVREVQVLEVLHAAQRRCVLQRAREDREVRQVLEVLEVGLHLGKTVILIEVTIKIEN